MENKNRNWIAATMLASSVIVGIAVNEGYSPTAKPPVKGDVCTDGFGNTIGVKCGDKTDPVRALIQLDQNVETVKSTIARCVHVPVSQNELNAYLSLAYNIGPKAFCGSTLVYKLNLYDYAGACKQILKWDKFHGKTLEGLKLRREREYKTCMGNTP